jgi:hypothetical protein
MTEPQEFDSIDALFRQKFKDLPESSAANGWDTPSERVWEHVRTHMPPPRAGWSRRNWSIVGAVAVSIALGLYWFSISAVQEKAAPVVAPAVNALPEQKPAPALAVPVEPATEAKPDLSREQTSKPVAAPKRRPAVMPNHVKTADTIQAQQIDPAAARPAFPNNAERHRAEALRQLWKSPIEPLPLVIQKDGQ